MAGENTWRVTQVTTANDAAAHTLLASAGALANRERAKVVNPVGPAGPKLYISTDPTCPTNSERADPDGGVWLERMGPSATLYYRWETAPGSALDVQVIECAS